MIRFTRITTGNKVKLIPTNLTYLLPTDIWWKIFGYLWGDKNVDQYNHENPMVSKEFYRLTAYYIGKGFMSDLFVLRRTCRLWKKVVEKYTNPSD